MHALRSRLAALLLVTFVAGGLVAPPVHHAEHNRTWDDVHDAIAAHANPASDGETGWTQDPDGHGLDALCCWLCAPLAFRVDVTSSSALYSTRAEAPPLALVRSVPEQPSAAASPRGPPALA